MCSASYILKCIPGKAQRPKNETIGIREHVTFLDWEGKE